MVGCVSNRIRRLSILIRPKSDHCLAQSLRYSVLFLNFVQIRFVKVVQWIVKIDTWICQSCHMDFLKLLLGFVMFLFVLYCK